MAHQQDLIKKVSKYVEKYMNQFDGSHDFNHIKRVVGMSHLIYSQITKFPIKTRPRMAASPLTLKLSRSLRSYTMSGTGNT
jgi:uncharacterized protein